jgi:hypothetical protein
MSASRSVRSPERAPVLGALLLVLTLLLGAVPGGLAAWTVLAASPHALEGGLEPGLTLDADERGVDGVRAMIGGGS